MPHEFPSDELKMPSFRNDVGEARDFLDRRDAILHPITIFKIARDFRELLHKQVDYTPEGYKRLLPEEIERRAEAGDKFLAMTPVEFPEEDRRLLEEG